MVAMEPTALTSMTKNQLIAELEKLRITENRYRTLLDNSSDAIFSFDKFYQKLDMHGVGV